MIKENIILTTTEIKATKLIANFLQSIGDAYEIGNESCKDYTETEAYKIAQEYLNDLKKVAKNGYLSYSTALFLLKQGCRVSRKEWGRKETDIIMKIQNTDENSKMTKPYLYMEKRFLGEVDIFPFIIDSENVLANDWFLVEE